MKKAVLLLLTGFLFFLAGCTNSTGDENHSITFQDNNNTQVVSHDVASGTIFIPANIPTKPGFLFKGYFLDPNFHFPMAFNTPIESDLTLYAKWEALDSGLDESEILQIVQELIDEAIAMDQQFIIDAILSELDIATLLQDQISSMIETAKESVVMIDSYSLGEIESGGSGVIYKKVSNTYYVVTNQHVVDGYKTGDFAITIFLQSGEVSIPRANITLLKSSVTHDLAVLRFTSTQNLPVMPFGDVNSLEQGQFVFALGSPLDLPDTVSMGIISAIDREMWDDYGMDTITIQHTASINSGNSGGALINLHGELIGINNMSYVDEFVGEGIEGLHFAIQIDIVKSILPTLE